MAIPRVKSTYSLDLETVQALDDLARRWGVPKSEALRRVIRAAAAGEGVGGPLAALDALQASARVSRAKAEAWVRGVRTEREASSRKARR
jgi:Ribbon-helix-helix protein, copG family